MPRKYDIGLAGKITPVEAKSESSGVQQPPDSHLWLSVLGTDARHQCAALSGLTHCLSFANPHPSYLLVIGFRTSAPTLQKDVGLIIGGQIFA